MTELQVVHLKEAPGNSTADAASESTAGTQNNPPAKPLAGALYYLPTGQVDVTVVRKITDCRGMEVDFDVSAEATVNYVPDLQSPLLIDYQALNAAFKKTTLNVTWYENGTLKSINGDMSDRSAAVISNIGAAGAQLMKIAAKATGVSALYTLQQACNSETREHVEQAKRMRKSI